MKRPTFVTMSTLVFTLVAYATLAQAAHSGEAHAISMVTGVVAALERGHVPGR